MEVEVEVKVFKVKKICPKCKQGEMRPTGMIFTSLPAQYEHICNCCGHKETFKKTYPSIEYKEVEKADEEV